MSYKITLKPHLQIQNTITGCQKLEHKTYIMGYKVMLYLHFYDKNYTMHWTDTHELTYEPCKHGKPRYKMVTVPYMVDALLTFSWQMTYMSCDKHVWQ